MIWLVVSLELLTFVPGLIYVSSIRGSNPALYQESAEKLATSAGLINTVILLTSGWLMALSISALRGGREKLSARLLLATMVTGATFLIVKALEYKSKLAMGLDLHYNEFFTAYWLMTGFHFIHVVIGLILLLGMWTRLRKGIYNAQNYYDVETSAVFWHMCDLIWILIFPVFYLIK